MRTQANMRFGDRAEAGRILGRELDGLSGRRDVVVLGLARGGVPVAVEVAQRIGAPCDVFVVKKVGAPGQPELALGAVASSGAAVLDERLAAILGVAADELQFMKARALVQAREREDLYRGEMPMRDLRGKTVVVVDDGLATGATMRVAVKAIRALGSSRIVVAVPVSAPDTAASMAREDGVDEFHCLAAPESFFAVGEWYEDFSPVTDAEVHALLAHGSARPSVPPLSGARAMGASSSHHPADHGKEVPR